MATETTPLLAREGETQQPAVLPPPEVLAAKAKFISPFRRLLLTCLLLYAAQSFFFGFPRGGVGNWGWAELVGAEA